MRGCWSARAGNCCSLFRRARTAILPKLLSEPSLIATDSIPATHQRRHAGSRVDRYDEYPFGGRRGELLGVSSENTGITLQVNARVNSSGVVTLMINQEISSVDRAASNSIGTAFDQQVVQTQITMMDGDTIAMGGLISEQVSNNTTGIPGLVQIPWIGWLFGTKSISKTAQRIDHVLHAACDFRRVATDRSERRTEDSRQAHEKRYAASVACWARMLTHGGSVPTAKCIRNEGGYRSHFGLTWWRGLQLAAMPSASPVFQIRKRII